MLRFSSLGTTEQGEDNWIVETKGRFWKGTETKDDAIKSWCKRVSEDAGASWSYVRINQTEFEARWPKVLGDLINVAVF